jgi:hypothetical protein
MMIYFQFSISFIDIPQEVKNKMCPRREVAMPKLPQKRAH